MTVSVKLTAALAAVAAALLTGSATGAPAARQDVGYGFLLTKLNMAFYRGDENIDCPEGRSHSVREAFLATQSAGEQARLLKPENARELETRYKQGYVMGRNGEDICTNSQDFDTPDRETQKLDQSRIGPGLDLDGAVDDDHPAPGTCAHKSFTSPSGDRGVDNQYFRAIGCNTFYRGASTGIGDGSGELQWGTNPVVMVIRGVTNWQDSADVRIEFAASPDKPMLAGGKPLSDASFSVTDDPRYRAVAHGRIAGGVLTTDPVDLVLPMNWVGASGGEAILRHARFRLRRMADGSLEGVAGAYRPIDNLVAVGHVGGPGVASTAGLECASVRKTLRILADGDRDPVTGQCKTVSEGFDFAAVPAFVFQHGELAGDPKDEATAQAAR